MGRKKTLVELHNGRNRRTEQTNLIKSGKLFGQNCPFHHSTSQKQKYMMVEVQQGKSPTKWRWPVQRPKNDNLLRKQNHRRMPKSTEAPKSFSETK